MKAGHADVTVHFARIEEPDTHSTLTARAFARHTRGEQLDAWWEVGVGPGTGPHMGRDIKTLRRWAWALHQLADALERHTVTGPVDQLEPDTQLTLADASIAAGHHPTIKIGAHR